MYKERQSFQQALNSPQGCLQSRSRGHKEENLSNPNFRILQGFTYRIKLSGRDLDHCRFENSNHQLGGRFATLTLMQIRPLRVDVELFANNVADRGSGPDVGHLKAHHYNRWSIEAGMYGRWTIL
jgi:hypothetical protein